MPYVIELKTDRYAIINPFGTTAIGSQSIVVLASPLQSAETFDQPDPKLLANVKEYYPLARYLQVVVNPDGAVRLGTRLNHAKVDERDNPWMILQELRTFAMACDAEERSIQPHEILDRIPKRGN